MFGPVLPVTYRPDRWITRDGNTLHVDAPLFGDGHGSRGRSVTTAAATRLYRNGNLVGEVPSAGVADFAVPGGAAAYRLEVEASRPAAFDLSTRVSVAWTFRSSTTTSTTRLPVATIRYFPELDGNHSAPSGRVVTVPVAVQEQATGVTRAPHELTAEVSYDGGRTWTPAEVVNGSALRLYHPYDAETVSLRARAVDGSGNTVEQTVRNARLR